MDTIMRQSFMEQLSDEPYARLLGIRVVDVEEGSAACEMEYTSSMDNTHGMVHGGAILSLIDETLGAAANSHGTVAVALNMNVTFIKPAARGMMRAESKELSRGARTATYAITVTDSTGMIAVCQALVFRKKEPFTVSHA
jgi:acyl-CoA thioesterase